MVFAIIGMLIVFVGLGLASIAAWKHTADRGRRMERLALANGFDFQRLADLVDDLENHNGPA